MNPPQCLKWAVIVSFVIVVMLPIFFMIVAPLAGSSSLGHETGLFDARHLTLARNSLGIAFGTTILSAVIGVPLAFLLARTNVWGRGVFSILYLIPILIPPYIHAIVWCRLNRLINAIFSFDIHSLFGAMLVLTLAYYPFVTLMTISGLKSVDRSLEEASLMRHGPWRTLKGIALPLVSPHIFSACLFVFIFSVVNFSIPDILRVTVYPVEIFIQFSAFYNEKAAALLSFPLIAITLILVVLQRWYMGSRSYVNLGAGSGRSMTYELGRHHPFGFAFCLIIFALSVFIPLAILVKEAGVLSNYIRMLSTSLDQITYSIVLAGFGGLATVVLALGVSYLIERGSAGTGISLEFASLIPFAIPGITLGIGLIKVWNRPIADLVYAGPFIIILGYVARFIPFTVRATSSGLKQINPHLEEAALLGGSSWMRVIRRIVVPLSWPSLLTGFFIAFILSLGELSTTLLIIPPGSETIPIKIYNLMHYGADHMVAALCLILVAITFACSGIFFLFYQKSVRIFQ